MDFGRGTVKRMRFGLHALCVISATVYVMSTYVHGGNDNNFNIQEPRKFLELHNEIRIQASVQPLKWDDELAIRVQRLVDACTMNIDLYSPTALMYQGEGNSPNDRSPELAMRAAAGQKRFVVNGRTDQCCSPSVFRCCRYAKVSDNSPSTFHPLLHLILFYILSSSTSHPLLHVIIFYILSSST
ncbi:hypothetical protein BsWGS_08721 [Bradybaena similaris]